MHRMPDLDKAIIRQICVPMAAGRRPPGKLANFEYMCIKGDRSFDMRKATSTAAGPTI